MNNVSLVRVGPEQPRHAPRVARSESAPSEDGMALTARASVYVRSFVVAGLILVTACSVPGSSSGQAWERWNSAMTTASEIVEQMDARRDVGGGYSVAVNGPREIPAMSARAVEALVAAPAPPGADSYRTEFIRLYRDRGSVEADWVTAIDASIAAGGDPFACGVGNTPFADIARCRPYKAAQETHDARLTVWRRGLADLKTRYNSWLVTQAR